MIPTCGTSPCFEQTIASVLNQKTNGFSLHVEVVDNSKSMCGVREKVEEMGNGRIEYFKQPEFRSMSQNWNTCLERARGDFIHILHDDDYIADTFYSEYWHFIKNNSGFGLYCCNTYIVDENGIVLYVLSPVELFKGVKREMADLLFDNKISTPSVVVRKECYDKIEGFNNTLLYVLDLEMWLRIIRNFGGIGINKNLAYYRVSKYNTSANLTLSGEIHLDTKRASILLANSGFNIYNQRINRKIALAALRQSRYLRKRGFVDGASNNTYVFKQFSYFWERPICYFQVSASFYYIKRFIYYLSHPFKLFVFLKKG